MGRFLRALYDPRLIPLAEFGYVPDPLIRWGIRRLLAARIAEHASGGAEARRERQQEFIEGLADAPIAPHPEQANHQHYDLPTAFFERILGRHLQYSCGLYRTPRTPLDSAEEAMLELCAQRAGLEDGMRILDLGSGWGSFSLWAAERFPAARITAVCNSKPQAEHIRQVCDARGLENLRVIRADMNQFEAQDRFDRIVSIEMFEHMRNWPRLLGRISQWLDPQGRLFLHYRCHRELAYAYESQSSPEGIGRHFSSGGMVPSEDLILNFQQDLEVERRWKVGGEHYACTSRAWLRNLDAHREEVLLVLASIYGGEARRWFGRWRLYFLACSEFYGTRGGSEWFVSHVLLAPRKHRRE